MENIQNAKNIIEGLENMLLIEKLKLNRISLSKDDFIAAPK